MDKPFWVWSIGLGTAFEFAVGTSDSSGQRERAMGIDISFSCDSNQSPVVLGFVENEMIDPASRSSLAGDGRNNDQPTRRRTCPLPGCLDYFGAISTMSWDC